MYINNKNVQDKDQKNTQTHKKAQYKTRLQYCKTYIPINNKNHNNENRTKNTTDSKLTN